MYKAFYQKIVNGLFAYFWQDPMKYPVKAMPAGTEMDAEHKTALASEEFEDEMLKLTRRQVGELMVVEHPDEPDAHDDHPDSSALMNYAHDSYNVSSGIFQYYAEGKKAEESAEASGPDQSHLSAIAEANKG
jgi:hypothetical protein